MTLREIQLVSLEIMKAVHEFCVENNIKYSIAYGTLIGAIRHKGFIPWDDDLDIIMPRPDYDRFCKSFKANGYEIVSHDIRKDCLISFARVCETSQTCIKSMLPWVRKPGNLGLWIDIFPIDSVSDNKDEFHKSYVSINSHHEKSVFKRRALRPFDSEHTFRYNLNTLKKRLLAIFTHSPEYHLDAMDRIIRKTEYGSTRHMAQIAFPDKEEYMDARIILDGYSLVPFEDSEFLAVNRFDELLTMQYGNYMELPPLEQRKPQQSYITFYWKKEEK